MPTLRSLVFLLTLLCARPVLAGWVLQSTPTTEPLYGVTFLGNDADIAWACGAGGTILFTDDGGATWVAQNSGTSVTLRSIAFQEVAGGPVIAVGDAGTLLMTYDNGTTWEPRTSGTSVALYGISALHFLVCGDAGTLLRSTDDGATWSPVSSGVSARLYAVQLGDFAVGAAGTILYSFDNGANWSVKSSGTTQDLFGLPSLTFQPTVVGDAGTVLQTSDSGNTWSVRDAGTSVRLEAVQHTEGNPPRIYCVGEGGTIVKSTDGGATWTHQYTPTSADLHGVFFYIFDENGYAVGDGGVVLKTTNGGVPTGATRPPSVVDHLQVTPNPVSGDDVRVSFELSRGGVLRVAMYDPAGRLVRERHRGYYAAGRHAVRWPARDSHGRALNSGVYFVRVSAGRYTATRKLTVVR